MMTDPQIGFACTEEFAELCALATTGALTLEECARLEKHVAGCQKCQQILAEYQVVASEGMAKLGAEMGPGDVPSELETSWRHAEARSQVLRKLRDSESERTETVPSLREEKGTAPAAVPALRRTWVQVLGIAAILLLGLSVGYRFGDKPSRPVAGPTTQNSVASMEQQLRTVEAQRDALNVDLAGSAKTIEDLTERAKRSEGALVELRVQKASLEARAEEFSATTRKQTDSLASLAGQRELLERRLAETEKSLKNVKDDLSAVQSERRKAQLRTASLETTIDELSVKLRERDEAAKRDEQFLASDRDVRELMGARQLYIADVFDVDQSGTKRRPFGRVFYTKGKSLIFYAFDLDQQPAYRDAKAQGSKAFEVWGTAGQDNTKPVGLGVFYMDSEANRRWVFKSNDPDVLAHVDAVFVTVESKEGSKRPSGKPFLYAYLRTAPANHP
jgi:hypothetical protein